MKFILGKKIDMTQVWKGDTVIPVTRVQAGPCAVVQVKSADRDGYDSVQLGFGLKREKNLNKPQKGHLQGLENFRYLREFRIGQKNKNAKAGGEKQPAGLKKGDLIDAGTFKAGDMVKVTGISKGKGFQGVVKRHGFHGQDKTHGNKDQLRMPGSIGATGPQHVFKGVKMPGRMGGGKTTVNGLEIIEVDASNGYLYIKGAIPGARNGLVMISAEGDLKIGQPIAEENVEQPGTEENVEQPAIQEEKKPAESGQPAAEKEQPAKDNETGTDKQEK